MYYVLEIVLRTSRHQAVALPINRRCSGRHCRRWSSELLYMIHRWVSRLLSADPPQSDSYLEIIPPLRHDTLQLTPGHLVVHSPPRPRASSLRPHAKSLYTFRKLSVGYLGQRVSMSVETEPRWCVGHCERDCQQLERK